MHILICSPSFPTKKTIDFVFVDQLCRALADLGIQITVIAPQSVSKCFIRRIPLAPRHSFYKTINGNQIELYRPYFITFGKVGLNLFKNSFQKSVYRAYNCLNFKPDVCYGHFWKSIYALYPMAKKDGIPLFGASGEENVSSYIKKEDSLVINTRNYLSGVISVSTKNQSECLSLQLLDQEKSIVIPNGIDQSLFRKLNKSLCRQKMGIKEDVFLVAFVGQFVPRKGVLRLNSALKKIGDKKVKAVFIGSGSENPDYEGIIYKGRVNHDIVPLWMNASDVFVLPTENEGCCNAIIEAMACGLPVISTDASFNYDILNEGNSIMVDCNNVDAISQAICRLKDDIKLRERLSEGALVTAKGLSINQRAKKIICFIQNRIKLDNKS